MDRRHIYLMPLPDDTPSMLYYWRSGNWRYEILDNPNGPYIRKVWLGIGTPVFPAVDPLISMIINLLDKIEVQVDD